MMLTPGIKGRIYALLLLVTMLVPLGWLGYVGASRFHDLQAEWDDEAGIFDKVRSIASFDVTRFQNENSDARLEEYGLGHEPATILVAKLQSKLRDVASQHGIEILQASDLEPTAIQEGLQKIGTRLQVVGQFRGILELLQQIGQTSPMLLVESVEVHSPFVDGAGLQAEPPLTVSIDVWGLVPTAQSDKSP